MIIVNLHHVALILDTHTRAHTHQLGSISLLFFLHLFLDLMTLACQAGSELLVFLCK